VALLTATALVGCSGTRFGDQLARSFSAPQQPAASPATPNSRSVNPSSGKPAQKPASSSPATPPPAPQPPAAARPAPRPAAAPSTPAPYRVTIRLPAADPSAPAEQVTEVLRAAGVPFEVETIERIGSSAGSANSPATSPMAPLRTPAPAPR
jgi:hypothetical protein